MCLYRSALLAFIITGMLCISGCQDTYSKMIGQNDFHLVRQEQEDTDLKAVGYEVGKKLKSLSDISDIDTPVILVNGEVISKRDIENAKIFAAYSGTDSTKKRIISLIDKSVLQSEAKRLGIEPCKEDIDDYMEKVKADFIEFSPELTIGYIEGMDITQEEYFDMVEKMAYNMYQREALWKTVKKDNEDEYLKEAKQRNVSLDVVEKEYRDKYIDELLNKADIKYLDSEIEKLMSDKTVE